MNTLLLLKNLEKYPLFTINLLAKEIRKPIAYTKLLIYRLCKRGLVKHIEKGKYTLHDDPLLFSSHIVNPSYLALWSALFFHNLTTQIPFNVQIITANKKRNIKFNETKIFFFKSKYVWGYKKEQYTGYKVFVSDPEKTILDCILTKEVPLSYVEEALDQKFNIKKLIEYVMRTKNKVLMKRLGFLLEEKGFNTKELKHTMDNNYILLDYLQKKTGKKIAKWRIIDNR